MSPVMRSYMRSHLRANLKTLLYLLGFAIAITFIMSVPGQRTESWHYIGTGERLLNYHYDSMLGLPVTILSVSAFALPLLEFSFFKKRRNLDCAYALPISRREMGLVHFLTGLALLVIPFTCSYFINYALLLRYPRAFDVSPLLAHYFLILCFGVCIYAINTFIFNEANSVIDGACFVILWTFVFVLVSLTISSILYDLMGWERYSELGLNFLDSGMIIPIGPLGEATSEYSYAVDKHTRADLQAFWADSGNLFWMAALVILGIVATVGFVFSFGRRAAQKTEELSDSWFGYRVMIPIYAVCGMLLFDDPGMWVIIEGVAFVGYVIYRKGFHLKKSDWIVLALLVFFLLLGGVI